MDRDEENRLRVESYVRNSTISLVSFCLRGMCELERALKSLFAKQYAYSNFLKTLHTWLLWLEVQNFLCYVSLRSRKLVSTRLSSPLHSPCYSPLSSWGPLTAVPLSRPRDFRCRRMSTGASGTLLWVAATRRWRTTRMRRMKAWEIQCAPRAKVVPMTRTARPTAPRCLTHSIPASSRVMACWGPNPAPIPWWWVPTPRSSTRPR